MFTYTYDCVEYGIALLART
jgi:hypothetical protein